jgi:3(or 17)beta-hydroxysteroid dehydrogenase
MNLAGKTAIVTGGAGGIGGETARQLAAAGAKVLVTDVQESAGKALAGQIGATFVRHDVSDEGQWNAVVQSARAFGGAIDILVNSAGISGDLASSGLATTLAEWRRVLSINLDGTFLGCRTVMPIMLEAGQGSIINISSATSFMATPTALAYGASKAGVEQLSRSMAIIGARGGKQVRCNSVHPGVIATDMHNSILSKLADKLGVTAADVEAQRVSAVPLGRRGAALDIANMIVFLASDEARYITGSAMRVDGGWTVTAAG